MSPFAVETHADMVQKLHKCPRGLYHRAGCSGGYAVIAAYLRIRPASPSPGLLRAPHVFPDWKPESDLSGSPGAGQFGNGGWGGMTDTVNTLASMLNSLQTQQQQLLSTLQHHPPEFAGQQSVSTDLQALLHRPGVLQSHSDVGSLSQQIQQLQQQLQQVLKNIDYMFWSVFTAVNDLALHE